MYAQLKLTETASTGIFLFCVMVTSPAAAGWSGLAPEGPLGISLEEAPELFEQCSRGAPRPEGQLWLPQDSVVAELEIRLQGYFDKHERQRDWLVGKQIRKFRGQYVGFARGDIDFVYASYTQSYAGRRLPPEGEAIVFCDGGASSWGIVYNPKTGDFSEFFGNGN